MLSNRFFLTGVALLGFASLAAADQVRGVVVKVDGATGQLTIEAARPWRPRQRLHVHAR